MEDVPNFSKWFCTPGRACVHCSLGGLWTRTQHPAPASLSFLLGLHISSKCTLGSWWLALPTIAPSPRNRCARRREFVVLKYSGPSDQKRAFFHHSFAFLPVGLHSHLSRGLPLRVEISVPLGLVGQTTGLRVGIQTVLRGVSKCRRPGCGMFQSWRTAPPLRLFPSASLIFTAFASSTIISTTFPWGNRPVQPGGPQPRSRRWERDGVKQALIPLCRPLSLGNIMVKHEGLH